MDAAEPIKMKDWEMATMIQGDVQKSKQTTIQDWTEKAGNNSIPEGRNEVKTVKKTSLKRRTKGKLTKKEQLKMKKTHRENRLAAGTPSTTRGH